MCWCSTNSERNSEQQLTSCLDSRHTLTERPYDADEQQQQQRYVIVVAVWPDLTLNCRNQFRQGQQESSEVSLCCLLVVSVSVLAVSLKENL